MFRVDYPDYIPQNNAFDVSVFSRIIDEECDDLHFYLLLDDYVDVNSVSFIDEYIQKKLSVEEANFYDFYGKAYSVNIQLDSLGLTHSNFFQLIINLEATNYHETKVAFGLECHYRDGTKKVFSSYDFLNNSNLLPIIPIRFFEPQFKAGDRLKLRPHSFLRMRIDEDESSKNLMVEFWAKLNSSQKPFFEIMGSGSSEPILSLTVNINKLLSAQSKDGEEYFRDQFVSDNSWTHFTVFFNSSERTLEIYANDYKVITHPLERSYKLNDLNFEFSNQSQTSDIELDLLKVWRYNDVLEESFLNKHYKNYSAKDSKLFASFDFDDDNQLRDIPSSSSLKIDYNNISFNYSDAPVFSKAPELNVVIYGGFYSIEWEQKELSVAKEFILEKSYSGKDFEQIYTTYADDDLSKVYYYSDEKRPTDEIVYYRLQQINKGGAKIFSSTVKIGQVDQLTFDLEQNYPNPFNPETQITIEMYEAEEIEIYVYDLVGKKIKKLHEGSLGQGRHTFSFDGSNLPSGIYFFEAKTSHSSVVRKMILAK